MSLTSTEMKRERETELLFRGMAYRRAIRSYHEAAAPGAEFRAQVAVGRARAWRALGGLDRAAGFQEAALRDTPRDAARWMELADLYQALGRADNAQQARRRAAELRAP